jgi:hypothetical protein
MIFMKVLRVTAWILIAAAFVALLSGFLMIKFFLTPSVGYDVYRNIHTLLVPLFFVPILYLHSLSGAMSVLYRKNYGQNKIVKAVVIILWTAAFASFAFLYVVQPGSTTIVPNTTQSNSVLLTSSEIAAHSSASNCWLIINSKVYDVTNFIAQHPGGNSILPYCGKEATAAFDTKGSRGSPHSSLASSLLNGYFIGNAGENSTGTAPNPSVPNLPREDDDD